MADRLQIRRDTAANWTEANPILAQGEWGYELDFNRLKIGDGILPWVDLPYFAGGGGGYVMKEIFTYSSSNVFTLSETPSDIIAVDLRGQVLDGVSGLAWTLDGNDVTVLYDLESGDSIQIIYTVGSIGGSAVTTAQAQTIALGIVNAQKDEEGGIAANDTTPLSLGLISELGSVSRRGRKVAIVREEGRAGIFGNLPTGNPDGGIVFESEDGTFWHRRFSGPVDVRWFGAIGDYNTGTGTGTDNTSAIQAALDYANENKRRIHAVYVPAGQYMVTQIIIPTGTTFYGDGAIERQDRAATKFYQQPGSNLDVIRFEGDVDPSSGRAYWMGKISDFSIMGSLSSASGWGLSFRFANDDRIALQDISVIERIIIRQMPSGGMEFPDGGLPVFVSDLKFLFNGGPGIYFHASTQNRFQAVNFNNVSGDGNEGGLIKLKGLDNRGNVVINNLKSEYRTPNPFTGLPAQFYPVVIEDCVGTPVRIDGATHISSVNSGGVRKPGDLIQITGTGTPRIEWANVAIRVRPTDLNTDPDPVIIAGSSISYLVNNGSWPERFGTNKGHAWVMGKDGIWRGRSVVNEGPVIQIQGETPALSLYNADGSPNQKHWLALLSGGTFTVRKVNDDGTAEIYITFSAGGNSVTMNKRLNVSGAAPFFGIFDTGAGANEKNYALRSDAGALQVIAQNDALNESVVHAEFLRSGTASRGVRLRTRLILSGQQGQSTPQVISGAEPVVNGSSYYITNNTSLTEVIYLNNGEIGQIIYLEIGDDFTKLVHRYNTQTAILFLRDHVDETCVLGDVYHLIRTSVGWKEIGRYRA